MPVIIICKFCCVKCVRKILKDIYSVDLIILQLELFNILKFFMLQSITSCTIWYIHLNCFHIKKSSIATTCICSTYRELCEDWWLSVAEHWWPELQDTGALF